MKRIAALTMVRNDEFFLRRWVAYYGRELGRENIFVFFDGIDQTVPDFCEGVCCTMVPHIEGNVAQADRGRIDFLSGKAAELFAKGYEMVIGTDVDEFLAVDPQCGNSLVEFLSDPRFNGRTSISGLGIDVGENTRTEAPVDPGRPFLSQRAAALLSTRYSKSAVIAKAVSWGSGFHRTRHHNFHIVKDLYLFHFGCVDLARIEVKFSDRERMENGWSRHFLKRIRTISVVSSSKARTWDRWTAFARRTQNIVRPPYAWNKPAMFNLKICVRIPERFRELV